MQTNSLILIGLLLVLIGLLLFLILTKPPKKPEIPLNHTPFVEMEIYRDDFQKRWNPPPLRKFR
jgi:nucleoside recognition membrane protein YjiH